MPRALVLDMRRVPDIEFFAVQMMIERDRRAMDRGAAVWLASIPTRSK